MDFWEELAKRYQNQDGQTNYGTLFSDVDSMRPKSGNGYTDYSNPNAFSSFGKALDAGNRPRTTGEQTGAATQGIINGISGNAMTGGGIEAPAMPSSAPPPPPTPGEYGQNYGQTLKSVAPQAAPPPAPTQVPMMSANTSAADENAKRAREEQEKAGKPMQQANLQQPQQDMSWLSTVLSLLA